jgi:hypothetical protein
MKSVILATGLMALAGQATALSCVRPDPIATFQQVAAAPEAYFVLYGQLTFDESALPAGVSQNSVREPAPIPAQFVGKGLTTEGFTNDYISPVTLQVGCAGPWCGSARSGVDALYFVRANEPPVTMQASPCGGMIFEEPDQATLDAITACMQGGPCLPQRLQ